MKISACMIVKNEESVIARCIESYRMAVDEIIVVDTGSTDRTVEIAKSMGAKLFHFTWKNDFAVAKNFAISKSKGDWIVFLDADEYFANGTGHNIRHYLENLDASFNAVACKMINLDQNTGKILDELTHVRLFKNDKHIRYVNPIHEMLQNTGKTKKIDAFLAANQDILIYHTGYSYDNREEKARRNLELLLKEIAQPPIVPAFYHYIADCYFGLEEWEKVIEFTRLFMASGVKFAGYNVRPHNNLIDAMLQLKYPAEEIMREIEIGIEKFPDHPIFHFYKANLLYDLKKYDDAFSEYQKTLKLHESYQGIEINSLPVNLWAVYNAMGAIQEYRNDVGAAVESYADSLKLDLYNASCFDRLIKLIRFQPDKDIILFINTLYNLDNEADLDFLATRLVNHRVPLVLAYYTNLREKKFPKHDYVLLQMLVANKYYDKAFSSLIDCYLKEGDRTLATVTATAALLSNREDFITRCLENLPPSLSKIIRVYIGEEADLTDSDKQAYLSLVHTFILWADDNDLEQLLCMRERFPDDIDMQLGGVFIKEGYYQMGLQFYDFTLRRFLDSDSIAMPGLYYNRAYCLHRMDEYYEAADSFLSAYEAGYRVNDIFEFLRWNLAKMDPSNKLSERIKEILKDRAESDEFVQE